MSRKYLLHLLFIVLSYSLHANYYTSHTDSVNRARELYTNGVVLARNGFYLQAIDSFNISLHYREKLYGKFTYETGLVHNALGINYKNIGNYNKSLDHYLQTEKAYKNDIKISTVALSRLYNNIGILYTIKLKYNTAMNYLQQAEYVQSSSHDYNPAEIAEIHYSIADLYYKQNQYKQVIEIAEKYVPDAYEDTKLLFLSLKAASLKELNLTNEAMKAYRETIDYAISYYSEKDPNVVYEYINFAIFLLSVERFDEAVETLNKVNDIFRHNNIREGTTMALYYRTWAIYYEDLKVETSDINKFRKQKSANLREAINYYNKGIKALGLNQSALNNAAVAFESSLSLTQSLELIKAVADAYARIADIYPDNQEGKEINALKEALEYYKITAAIIQQSRRSMYSDEDKIKLAELEEATFQKMIETAYKTYRRIPNPEILEFAFTSAERMKASSVFDRLSDQLAKENSLIPDSLTDLERMLNYNITSQNEKLYNLKHEVFPDSIQMAKTDSVLFQLNKHRDELTRYLETNYRDYYNMKYSGNMIGIADVKRKLRNNEILIEYVLNETLPVPELYAFVITSSGAGFHKLNADSAFIRHLEATFRFVSNPAYLFTRNEDSKAYCVSANYLYRVLLEPFSGIIRHKRVTIIPDGKLSYLPFDALLTEMPDTSGIIQFNALPYLIRHNTISYSYSANLLLNFKKQGKKAGNRLLAFAPEYNYDTISFSNEQLVLIPLPGVQREIELIGRQVKARLFKGKEATELNFREHSRDHDILHLAMHAFINDSLPAFSRFAFSQIPDTMSNNDGWLNTADIYNLDLKARLTVLSACNTGSGNLKKGEGLMSLARGFLYAGCPSIVMTMWEVEDNAGTEIMQSFYQILKKGRKTDEALRQAKLKYLNNANPRMAHPHYWLSYVNIGSTEPLFRSYDFYFFGLLILALAGITADQFIRMKRNGRRKK